MKDDWKTVKLGEVLTRSDETVLPTPDAEYGEITVRLWGKGVVARGRVMGSSLSGRRFVARSGQFIASRIDARNGAMGLVPDTLDGALVTNDFPLFFVDGRQMAPAFLGWLSRTRGFVELCLRASEGTTNRVRLKEQHFLNLEIPLPPLAEQRRIVARIDELAAHIQEARTLRQQAAAEVVEIMASAEQSLWPIESLVGAKKLEDVTVYLARGRQSEQGESGHFLIKTQHVQQGRYIPTTMQLASHVAVKVQNDATVKDNDILIACSAAGCLGRVARYRGDSITASTDTHVAVARANTALVDPDYLYAYLIGSQGQHQLRSRERGDWQREKISFRLTELNLNDLRQVPVPVPSFSEQRRIVAELDTLHAQVDALRRLHAETAAKLDAMLPSILDRAFAGNL